MKGEPSGNAAFLFLMLIILFLAGCAAHGSPGANVSNSSNGTNTTMSSTNTTALTNATTANTTAPAETKPATTAQNKPLIIPHVYSEQEREALASSFLARLQGIYRQEDWEALYGLLRSEDRAMPEDEFAFFMDVTGYPVREQYDPFYSYLGRSWRLDPALGTGFEVTNLSFNGTEATAVVNMTYGGVHVQHRPFVLDWEGGSWHVELASILNGTTADEICANSGVAEYCFSKYASETANLSYCAKSGRFVVGCYAQFNETVPTAVAVTVCGEFPTRSAADGCLNMVALSTHDPLLCEATTIPTNTYECMGIVNLSDCLAAVNRSADTAGIFQGMCYFGQAVATHDASLCKYVPNTNDLLKQQCLQATS